MIIKLTEIWIALAMSMAALLLFDLVSFMAGMQDPRTREAAFIVLVAWILVGFAVLVMRSI